MSNQSFANMEIMKESHLTVKESDLYYFSITLMVRNCLGACDPQTISRVIPYELPQLRSQ